MASPTVGAGKAQRPQDARAGRRQRLQLDRVRRAAPERIGDDRRVDQAHGAVGDRRRRPCARARLTRTRIAA